MPDERRLNPDDQLYRRLDPGKWDQATGKLKALAFLDDDHPDWPGLSFSLARHFKSPSPQGFLRSHKRSISSATGVPVEELTAEKIYELGYGIAVIDYATIQRYGLTVIPDGELDYKSNGHVDLLNGRRKATEFKKDARVLTREEIFGK